MKVHVLAPNIVIDITFNWFEAGQKLVRSRSNYFSWIAIEVVSRENTHFFLFFFFCSFAIDCNPAALLTTENAP